MDNASFNDWHTCLPATLHLRVLLLVGDGVIGWCDGAGKTSSAGASYNLDTVGQGPTALAVGAERGCLDIFTLIYPFSSLSPSLWETARYRLKYCLKGSLSPKQPTNQHLVGDLVQELVIDTC